MKQPLRKPWGESRLEFVRIRDEIVTRLAKGEPLTAIHRELEPKMGYSTLAYHVKKLAKVGPGLTGSSSAEAGGTEISRSTPDKLARLRQLGEKAGHHGKRSVYDPSANSHEDLFGPPKE